MQNMTFGQAVKTVFRKYAVFKGRARRAEYWWFTLFNIIVEIGLIFLMGLCSIPFLFKGGDSVGLSIVQNIFSVASSAWSLALLLPTWAVLTRRLHDIGRSGWWVVLYALISLVVCAIVLCAGLTDFSDKLNEGHPGLLITLGVATLVLLAMGLVILIWTIIPGHKGDNKYGPDPKAEPETVDITFPAADSVAETTATVADVADSTTADNQ